MSFKRKVMRKNRPTSKRCCGCPLTHKGGYDTDTHEFWFCEVCGKEKWIEKRDDNGNN